MLELLKHLLNGKLFIALLHISGSALYYKGILAKQLYFVTEHGEVGQQLLQQYRIGCGKRYSKREEAALGSYGFPFCRGSIPFVQNTLVRRLLVDQYKSCIDRSCYIGLV